MSICLIANPAAGGGRGSRLLPAAVRALEAVGPLDVRVTAEGGDERRLVADALDAGHDTLAVLGGDGTWSKVARALVDLDGGSCRLALLAAGTGNDLAKSVGAPAHDFAAMAGLCAAGGARPIDAARIDDVVFVNIAGLGFDAEVLSAMRRLTWLRGTSSYAVAALTRIFRYRGFEASIDLEGARDDAREGSRAREVAAGRRRWLGIFLANGGWFGGAFRIAPDARIDDGLLDVIALGDASAWRRMRLFAAALGGTHRQAREVSASRARVITIACDAPPLVDADGELHRAPSATVRVECLPAALRVVSDA